jgi:diaminohydroxyphosphoribosylaminopyrimidine deaminase/5-amino-6-(5-phosphoribosylamino)uracil reductase
VLEEKARHLNEVFIKYITQQMPFVVAKSAQTLDGKIATATGQSRWITSASTRIFSRKLRDEFDAVLVGRNTVEKDDPRLTASKKSRKLLKVVVDSGLELSLRHKIFRGRSAQECIVAATTRASAHKIKTFSQRGIEVMVYPRPAKQVPLKWLFRKLAQKEISSLLLEGGARVIGSALKDGLVDKMHIFLAPKIIGDQNAVSSIDGLKIDHMRRALRLEDLDVQRINGDIFISGYVHRNR